MQDSGRVARLGALIASLSVALMVVAAPVSGQDLDQPETQDRDDLPPPDQRDVPYAGTTDPQQTLDIYLPTESGESRPAVIFIHGGGFRKGTKSTFRLEGDLARQRGWVGFSINYRLDAEPGHPTEMNDVLQAVEWVRSNAGEYGVDPGRIALWGTSAGGNLGALAATAATGSLSEGNRVIGVVSFSGPMDLGVVYESRPDNAATVEAYMGCAPTDCPDLYASASVGGHVSADDPTMFLAHGVDEGLPASVSEDLAERLEREGVPVELVLVPSRLHARALSLRTPGLMDDAFDWLEQVFADTAEPNPPPAVDDPGVSTTTEAATESNGSDSGSTGASTSLQPSPDDADDAQGNQGRDIPWRGLAFVSAAFAVGAMAAVVVLWRRR